MRRIWKLNKRLVAIRFYSNWLSWFCCFRWVRSCLPLAIMFEALLWSSFSTILLCRLFSNSLIVSFACPHIRLSSPLDSFWWVRWFLPLLYFFLFLFTIMIFLFNFAIASRVQKRDISPRKVMREMKLNNKRLAQVAVLFLLLWHFIHLFLFV